MAIGWIAAGILVGRLGLEATEIPMRIAAGASVIMGLYCLMLPHTPPARSDGGISAPMQALKLLRDPAMFVLFVAAVMWKVAHHRFRPFMAMFLALTLACAFGFLVVKGVEYTDKFGHYTIVATDNEQRRRRDLAQGVTREIRPATARRADRRFCEWRRKS